MNIFLIGYMYSGKTTIGHQLARALDCPFYDTDQLFEERFRTTIPCFFQRYGEEAFRQLERQVLHGTEQLGPAVIATGGGTPCHFDNMEWINAHGISVYCDTSFEVLLSRAAISRKARPILASKTPEERHAFMQLQLAERHPFYQQARITFPANDPDIPALLNLVSNSKFQVPNTPST